jgi:gliding motility-associated lipoprotein GldH
MSYTEDKFSQGKMKRFLFIIMSAGVLFSCSPGKIYEKHVKMENLAWNRFNTITFNVPIEDISPGYDILVAIRHITDIPYRDLEVNVYLTGPDGETRSRDITIRIKDNEGKNLGDGLGELWDIQSVAWRELKFSVPGTCKVEVSSGMSQLDLIGVMEVGLVVTKSRK